ncbi:MAG: EscU/YscU/HrcU family type III secretion system export apparatus switch protein [Acetobacteraceae bacterium]|nr:EscU/YscU/HrcU family type III secretion system export apparatus switch protein [Acetobacteraceae bacterium]
MSGQAGDQEDRTEAPTPRRLQKAREEGEVPVSREVVLLAGLAAMTLSFMVMDGMAGRALVRSLSVIMAQTRLEPLALFRESAEAFLRATALFAIPVALGAAAVTLAQTRFALRAKALRPDFGRLSPRKGLKRMFGAESLVETAKSLAKLLIVGGAAFEVLRRELPRLEILPSAPLTVLPELLASVVIRLLLAATVAQVAIAGADLFWMWRQHQRQLRMSRTDIKDEQKETDGDPAIKMRIRRIRMRRARQRMLAAVPKATVVVTNPTHYAVALTYDGEKSNVPILVTKGVDSMATRIREAATKSGVPIVANPPLARTLHQLPLNARIPPELYKAVAELIAYVWRLNGRQRP